MRLFHCCIIPCSHSISVTHSRTAIYGGIKTKIAETMEIPVYVGIAAIIFVFIYLIAKRSQRKKSKTPAKPGTVVLHQFPRDLFTVMSGSPPCLKLETFLRMTKIPYENDYSMKFSKQGKLPWIEFNGQEIGNSNFCIQFLEKEFQVDVDSHLSTAERAIGHCILTMLEENTYWTLVYIHWISAFGSAAREFMADHFLGFLGFYPVKNLLISWAKHKQRGNMWSHGIGRHTEQEIYGIAERDLLAVSEILGDKQFLFGDKPCLADAAVFAFIVACAWRMPESPIAQLTKTNAKNLEKHAQRMKEMYYPDWDAIMTEKPKSE